MWVNIDLDSSIAEITKYLMDLAITSSDAIYLSFNTTASYNEVVKYWDCLSKDIAKLGLVINLGPHFVDEGLVINNIIEHVDEIYFLTPGEKVIWYSQKYPMPDINTIIFFGQSFRIDPFIVKIKDKRKKYQYCFIQNNPLDVGTLELINSDDQNLVRIKGNEYENDN